MKNSYNFFFILFAFSVLFTIGFNLAEKKDLSETVLAEISVTVGKSKGSVNTNDKCFIDGRLEGKIIHASDTQLTFICEGSLEKAGFLMKGGKYLSKNQPVKIHSDNAYFEGRICNIICKTAAPA